MKTRAGRPGWLLVTALAAGLPVLAPARDDGREATGKAVGVVVTQDRALPLPDARVRAVAADGRVAGEVVTDGSGRFRIALPPGDYRLQATRSPFRPGTVPVVIVAGRATEARIALELALARLDETVEVEPAGPLAATAPATDVGAESLPPAAVETLPLRGDPLVEAQRLVAGTIQVPGGISIKGARPHQAAIQLGSANVGDASTGNPSFRLPWDALRSIEVLPNPYAVEFGRFSSGLTLLETRSGGSAWRGRVNNFLPSVRTRRGEPLELLGVERFGPQLSAGGPAIRDRLFVAASLEYRYESLDLRSRPQDDLRTSRALSGFTRLDAHVGRHLLSASTNVLSQRVRAMTLDTFTAPDAAADLRQDLLNVIVSDTVVLSAEQTLESLLQFSDNTVTVGPQADPPGPLAIAPGLSSGRFFARQRRSSQSIQWVAKWARSSHGGSGEHVLKAGIDVLHTRFAGERTSGTVSVLRGDGTLSRRLEWSAGRAQRLASTDVAVFVQDRWRPGTRWLLDAGLRLDRDGVVGESNATGRAGFMAVLDEAGGSVLRGGLGVFYERTPSSVGTFDALEAVRDQRFGRDGRPASAGVVAVPRSGDLHAPRSLTWSLGYTRQVGPTLVARVNLLARRGSREFVVQPREAGGVLALSSAGRSAYRELELGVRYRSRRLLELHASYTRSEARASTNAFSTLFGTVPVPVVGDDEYAPAPSDAPHRLIGRVHVSASPTWLVAAVVEARSGLPFGALDQFLDPVPPRNRYRMPAIAAIDLSVEHRVRVFGRQPWVGVRIYNATNGHQPTDVQRRLDAADFGATYNSQPRQLRLQLRFQ